MNAMRLPLFTFDVMRELCKTCGHERFQFVPKESEPSASRCKCGSERDIAAMSDTSVGRLVTNESGEFVIVPRRPR